MSNEADDSREDAIASTELIAVEPDGNRAAVQLVIHRPTETEDGDWSCRVEGSPLVSCPREGVLGMDSFQALLLALALVRAQLDDFVARGGRLTFPGDPESSEVALDALFGSLVTARGPGGAA